MNRRFALKATSAAIAAAGLLSFSSAFAADTIKVGVLHSPSGTMAMPASVRKDTALPEDGELNATAAPPHRPPRPPSRPFAPPRR